MMGNSAVELLSVRDVKNPKRLECAYFRGRALEIMSWTVIIFVLDTNSKQSTASRIRPS